MNDIPSIGCFDIKDPTAIVARWKRWIRTFEIYADGKGIKNAVQQKALLLHTAGMEVQGVFHKLNLVDDVVETHWKIIPPFNLMSDTSDILSDRCSLLLGSKSRPRLMNSIKSMNRSGTRS